jgi:hypothetical protein
MPPSNRTTSPLKHTHASTLARLDYTSRLSLEWLVHWVSHHGGLVPPHSGLIRRALAVYVANLENLKDCDQASAEVTLLDMACKGSVPPALQQQHLIDERMAEAVSEATAGGKTPRLPTGGGNDPVRRLEAFKVILSGLPAGQANEASTARMEALLTRRWSPRPR